MIGNVTPYFNSTALFLLLFLVMAALLEPYKEHVRWFLTKISWHTIIKIFCVWVGILFLRKLAYYIPLFGVIQTKDAIWSMEKEYLLALYVLLVLLLLVVTRQLKSMEGIGCIVFLVAYMLIILYISFAVTPETEASVWQRAVLLILGPLLLLKMACTGKYIGLLTSLILAYYTIAGRKKITKISGVKLLLTAGLTLGFVLITYYQFSMEWHWKLSGKLFKAQEERNIIAFEDLLAALHTVKDNNVKHYIYREIAVSIANTGDMRGAKEIFQQAIDSAEQLEDTWSESEALRGIALAMAKTGNKKGAIAAAKRINYTEMRNSTLKGIQEIREKIERK